MKLRDVTTNSNGYRIYEMHLNEYELRLVHDLAKNFKTLIPTGFKDLHQARDRAQVIAKECAKSLFNPPHTQS